MFFSSMTELKKKKYKYPLQSRNGDLNLGQLEVMMA